MGGVTVSRIGDRLVAVKTAEGDAAARLRTEARVLQALDHPGLVQVVEVIDTDGEVTMRTAFAGADTWATRPPEGAVERAAGIAAVAATLADLHARGVTHGALEAGHVIRGDHDRPVLCGLSRTRGDEAADRQADLAALAELIDAPALPDGPRAAGLAALANRIRSGRCQATDVVEQANRIAAETGSRLSVGRRMPRPLLVMATIAAAAATTMAVAAALPRLARTPNTPPALTAATSEPPTALPTATGTAEPPPATAEPAAADTTADSPSPGAVIDHGGRRYRIGQEGDVVVVGDWDCDGTPTPAVLRPATGDIAVFDRWPEPDASVRSLSAWVVDDAHDLTADAGSPCDRLRVHTTGESLLLDTGGFQ
jgi:hypothetical protein